MKWTLILILVAAFGCKSQEELKADPLPFHVAILPVDVEKAEIILVDEDDQLEVKLDIDPKRFSEAMVAALDGTAFAQATLLSSPEEGESAGDAEAAWVEEARGMHADLILDADLTFDEDIGTQINDKFWMNLPLFLLGGPATWFVNDRTYEFHVSIDANVYDVMAASRQGDILDPDSHVVRIVHDVKEASLDFLDRADGGGAYALSILIPSGFLSKDSDKVPEELEASVTEQLGIQVAQRIQDRAIEVAEAQNLVYFHPDDMRFVEEDGQSFLVGNLVLATGHVTELSDCAYRVNGGELREAALTEVRTEGGQKIYEVKLPVEANASVQLFVEQRDDELRARSYTYTKPQPEESK